MMGKMVAVSLMVEVIKKIEFFMTFDAYQD